MVAILVLITLAFVGTICALAYWRPAFLTWPAWRRPQAYEPAAGHEPADDDGSASVASTDDADEPAAALDVPGRSAGYVYDPQLLPGDADKPRTYVLPSGETVGFYDKYRLGSSYTSTGSSGMAGSPAKKQILGSFVPWS
ncbi:uncharacterized protein V1510DRAFT_402997 [Dipodascopsis tothii]|uniref:uncharacterized protein n=1 Tax=Dipodascopsis tothii TaxID=44089 RepID=UPI0034CF58DC